MSADPSKRPREWFSDLWATNAFTPLQEWASLFKDEDNGEIDSANVVSNYRRTVREGEAVA